MSQIAAPIALRQPPVSGRSWQRRLLGYLLYLCYLLLIAEIAARSYWKVARRVPFFKPGHIWYHFYSEIQSSGIESATVSNTDETFDILLLGGSTLSPEYGSIGHELQQQLQVRFGRPVRVFILAASAKTSRDSLLKYRTLRDKHFDLVVVYDGLNDTRMNNCPREVFRDDYLHCAWYRQVEDFQHRRMPWLSLPYTLAYLRECVAEKVGRDTISRHNPRDGWAVHGGDIKTVVPFRANLRAILDEAQQKGEPVLLMTFAYHIPADYSLERFQARALDYGAHRSALEIWGQAEHVAAGVDRHNTILRDLAARNDRVFFVDQQALMPKSGSYFDDCCHFTPMGCQRFVDHIVTHLGDSLSSREPREP